MEQEITSWENLFHGSLTDYLKKHGVDHCDGTFSSSNTKCNSSMHDAEGSPNLRKSWNSPSITISCEENSPTRNMNQSVGYHADDQPKAESVGYHADSEEEKNSVVDSPAPMRSF